MHGTSIFSNPVYISLYFPPSSNRDISMLFLALSYSYSEQCWSYINNACPFWYDAVSLQLLPFVITPPLPKTGKHNWFLARSDDGKRLMIIRTHEPEKLYCKNPTVYKHREIREYPDSGCYVYEQDTSLLGPLGFFSWRRVNSLGSHSLFLGLNYPINQEITVGKDLDGREALFAMENCVYTASPRSSGANSPDCQWYSLQPKEGENDKGIRINFDPWMSQLRQAVMWFKPSGW